MVYYEINCLSKGDDIMNIFDGLTFAEAEKKLEETKNKTLNSINERHTEFNKFMKKTRRVHGKTAEGI